MSAMLKVVEKEGMENKNKALDAALAQIEKQFLVTLWDDLEIWRYQRYVEHPALAQIDAKPFKTVRTWCKRFYEVPPQD